MKLKRTAQVSGAALILIMCCAAFSCNKVNVQNASSAVNRYAQTLSAFQDAEIKLHNDGKVADDLHKKILVSEQEASKAGRGLNAAIGVAAKNGDPSEYIALAEKTFNEMLTNVQTDVNAKTNLQLSINAAGDALKNAISLIQALKAQPAQSQKHGGQMPVWAFMLLPMFGMCAMGASAIGAPQVLQLLQVVLELEPVAFDFVLKLTQGLKGKTPEEIRAISDSIFDKVDSTAQGELDKLSGTTRVSPKT